MNDTVQHLTNEIYKVKERQKELETQLQSSSGPSVENLQRELRNEVETLHALYRDNTSIDNGGHHKLYNNNNELTKDLRQHKKYVENEMDSLRREMDNIKSRITRLEHGMNSNLRESQNAAQRCSTVERDVNELNDNQRYVSKLTSKKDRELSNIKDELAKLSNEMYGMKKSSLLTKKISTKDENMNFLGDDFDVDSFTFNDIYDNHHSSNPISTKKKKKHQKRESFLNDSSPLTTLLSNSSDIDLSIESLTIDFSEDKLKKKGRSLTLERSSEEVIYDDDAIASFIDQHEDLLRDIDIKSDHSFSDNLYLPTNHPDNVSIDLANDGDNNIMEKQSLSDDNLLLTPTSLCSLNCSQNELNFSLNDELSCNVKDDMNFSMNDELRYSSDVFNFSDDDDLLH